MVVQAVVWPGAARKKKNQALLSSSPLCEASATHIDQSERTDSKARGVALPKEMWRATYSDVGRGSHGEFREKLVSWASLVFPARNEPWWFCFAREEKVRKNVEAKHILKMSMTACQEHHVDLIIFYCSLLIIFLLPVTRYPHLVKHIIIFEFLNINYQI